MKIKANLQEDKNARVNFFAPLFIASSYIHFFYHCTCSLYDRFNKRARYICCTHCQKAFDDNAYPLLAFIASNSSNNTFKLAISYSYYLPLFNFVISSVDAIISSVSAAQTTIRVFIWQSSTIKGSLVLFLPMCV